MSLEPPSPIFVLVGAVLHCNLQVVRWKDTQGFVFQTLVVNFRINARILLSVVSPSVFRSYPNVDIWAKIEHNLIHIKKFKTHLK